MKNLINVIKYLQYNDKNGSYTDIIEDINGGSVTLDEGKQECVAILTQWKTENLAPSDIEEQQRINKLINSLNI